ncbi:MAG: CvpA family protein [Candidatus Omnitrophica bacterium]|nr:CvpA family protein [Candidatus Omnitrophota bacterium]
MDPTVLRHFNFLDIIILIILFRICYIALKDGLAMELFKLLGVLSAIYISSHFYISLSRIIKLRYVPDNISLEFVNFVIFVLLACAGYIALALLRVTFCRFMKMEAAPKLNKYGGLILGLARGYFTVGLLIYVLMITNVSYLNSSIKHSALASRCVSVSSQTYNWIWESIFSKFFPQEKPDSVVRETSDNLVQK